MLASLQCTIRGAVVLVCFVACAAGTAEPAGGLPAKVAAPTPTAPPVVAAPARTEPTPDPITRPLDESQARQEASRLAEAAFAARKDLVDGAGKPLGPQEFSPEDFRGGLEGDRWKLRDEPPAGAWAQVSFGKFGEHPEVEVGFASR